MAKSTHRDAIKAVRAFQKWLARVAQFRGIGAVATAMKEFAADCRLAAVKGQAVGPAQGRFYRLFCGPLLELRKAMDSPDHPGRVDILVQLSYLGRALPKGRKQEAEKAMKAHQKAFASRPPAIDDAEKVQIRAFARRWAAKFLPTWSPNSLEFSPTGGACLESNRKDGGLGSFLKEEMWSVLGQIPHHLKKITTYPVVEDDVALRAHAALAQRLRSNIEAEEGLPRAEVVAVAERGYKARIVTKSSGSLVALAHVVRKWCQEGLRADPAIREVLAGDHRRAVEELFLAASRRSSGTIIPGEVLSADLKSATDLISMELFQELWAGICDSEPGRTLPRWLVKVVDRALGPQILKYVDLPGTPHLISKRGALMGLPTTWTFLCLSNLYWWSKAHGLRNVPPVRICGDDLLGVSTEAALRRYEEAARQHGAVFSGKSKHFQSPHGGVFTEEVFTCHLDHLHDAGSVRWSEAFPLRGIVGTLRSDATDRDQPWFASAGPALQELMVERSLPWRRRILSAFRTAHPGLRGFLRKHRLFGLYHVPRQFGGFGVPTPDLWSSKVSLAGHHRMVAFGWAKGSAWDADLSTFSRCWDVAPHHGHRHSAELLARAGFEARYSVMRKGGSPPPGYLEFPGTVSGLADLMVTNVARDMFFLERDSQPKPHLSKRYDHQVARIIRQRIDAVVKDNHASVGWVRRWQEAVGGSVTFSWGGLIDDLRAVESERVAIYNPTTVRKEVSVIQNLADLERLRSVSHDRPSGELQSFREWADRQTKRHLGGALGWF